MLTTILRCTWCLLTPHLRVEKPGVGVIRHCRAFKEISFRPDLPGAKAHRVPADDDDCVRRILECDEPLSAMAILREAQRAAAQRRDRS